MKKILLVLILAAIVAVGGVGYLVLGKKNANTNTATKTGDSATATPVTATLKKACDTLTQADADAVLGVGSTKTESSGSADVVTPERSVTTCNYKIGSATDLKQATVLLRASTSSEAKTSFDGAKMSDATDASGIGETAYWSPTYGQLNVLKGGTWMIVSVGGPRVSDKSQDLAKTLATRLVTKL